jgi:hypothetical protein
MHQHISEGGPHRTCSKQYPLQTLLHPPIAHKPLWLADTTSHPLRKHTKSSPTFRISAIICDFPNRSSTPASSCPNVPTWCLNSLSKGFHLECLFILEMISKSEYDGVKPNLAAWLHMCFSPHHQPSGTTGTPLTTSQRTNTIYSSYAVPSLTLISTNPHSHLTIP